MTNPLNKSDKEGRHFVQFYQEDTLLIDALTQFIYPSLKSEIDSKSTAVIIVASSIHRNSITSVLQHQGINVNHFIQQKQLILLDASDTLAKLFEPNNSTVPDKEKFNTVVGGLIRCAFNSYSNVLVYGEMVDILCERGLHNTAIQLEELWNDLGNLYPFKLLCGYSMNNFQSNSQLQSFRNVCTVHSHVVPPEMLNVEQIFSIIHSTLNKQIHTIPFSLLYLFDLSPPLNAKLNHNILSLKCHVGIKASAIDNEVIRKTIAVDKDYSGGNSIGKIIMQCLQSNELNEISSLEETFIASLSASLTSASAIAYP